MHVALALNPHLFVPPTYYPTHMPATPAPLPSYSTTTTCPIPPHLNDHVKAQILVPLPYGAFEQNGTTWFSNAHFPGFVPPHSSVQSEWTGGNSYLPPSSPQFSAVSPLALNPPDYSHSKTFGTIDESTRRITQYSGSKDPSCTSADESSKVIRQTTILALDVGDRGSFPFESPKMGGGKPTSKTHNRRVSISVKPVLPGDKLQTESVSQISGDKDKRKVSPILLSLSRNIPLLK
jgi:hypothetical protein